MTHQYILDIRVAAFVRKLAEVCWDGGDVSGGELQRWMVDHGLLRKVTMSQPCDQDDETVFCVCKDADAAFPTSCYRPNWTVGDNARTRTKVKEKNIG